MTKVINWTGVAEIAGRMHNYMQDDYAPLDEKLEQDAIYKILELLGLDTGKIYDICDEIDGCCFEIAQGTNRDLQHLVDESCAIDKCATDLRYMFDDMLKEF